MNQSTQNSTGLAGRITSAARTALEQLFIATLDPDFPSVVIPPALGGIGEPAVRYERLDTRPDFVREDDKGWGGQ